MYLRSKATLNVIASSVKAAKLDAFTNIAGVKTYKNMLDAKCNHTN